MSGHGGCKHDIHNFQHLCTLVAKPCAYVGHIDTCPYLAAENAPKKGERPQFSKNNSHSDRNDDKKTAH